MSLPQWKKVDLILRSKFVMKPGKALRNLSPNQSYKTQNAFCAILIKAWRKSQITSAFPVKHISKPYSRMKPV